MFPPWHRTAGPLRVTAAPTRPSARRLLWICAHGEGLSRQRPEQTRKTALLRGAREPAVGAAARPRRGLGRLPSAAPPRPARRPRSAPPRPRGAECEPVGRPLWTLHPCVCVPCFSRAAQRSSARPWKRPDPHRRGKTWSSWRSGGSPTSRSLSMEPSRLSLFRSRSRAPPR